MKFLTVMTFCLLCLLPVAAQDTSPAPQGGEAQYFVAAGAGFNRYADKQASGWLTFGARIAPGLYTYSLLTMTDQTSTIGQGFMKVLIRQDGFTLSALGDAGVAAGEGAVGSAFAGGGSLNYDISRWTKVPKTWVTATVKVAKTTLGEAQPVFCFGFGKSF
ncbi:hypothetical protein [uncultured Paludibaculum sp.]|uniref:hypothetical protein n=1 Tax=uncultured Paludibaculum sp. TaxID=1765020 RepID=UPI002AABA548|nr:hypothetical protein [uncultured Paludibaculum sp.]